MKGLLRKDFTLIMEQKIVFLTMCIIAMAISFMGENGESFAKGFINSYITCIAAVVGMSTISYDESDNGLLYIMSMPVNRKMYVSSKYLISMIMAFLGAVISTILNVMISVGSGESIELNDMFLATAAVLSIGILIFSIGIPGYLKFGPQKGVVIMIVVIMGIIAICFGLSKLLVMAGIDLEEILTNLSNIENGAFAGLLLVVAAICALISYGISQKIMAKKEF